MDPRFPDRYSSALWADTLLPRTNDVLAEICRALIHSGSAEEVVQAVAERLQRYFGMASIGICIVREDVLELRGLCLPERIQDRYAREITERWGRVPLDSNLPGPRAMRVGRALRWGAGSPDLDPEVRRVLADVGARLLVVVPALLEEQRVACGIVAISEGAEFSWEDEALLENALGVLAIFYERARLHDLERERHRRNVQDHHLAAMGELAAGVAHEVNNPLAAVTHLAELLLSDPGLGADSRLNAEAVLSEARRAAKTIQRLQSFARVGGDEREPLDVSEMVAEVLALLRRRMDTADVRVSVEIAPGTPAVLGQRAALQGVLLHLLTNARRATEETDGPSIIRVVACRREARVELTVEDTGPGFTDYVRRNALTPFFTTGDGGPGRGLGLSVASAVLHDQGGELVLENWGRPPALGGEAGEGGARVVVRLPATASRPASALPAVEAEPSAAERPRLHILLVEDEEAVALPLVKYLRRSGHHVTDVRSGEEALASIEAEGPPDVIFSDVRMPGMGGAGLYRALQQDHPELVERIVFTSGDVGSPQTESFLRSTRRPFLAKPYPLDHLDAILASVTGDAE